MDQAPVLRGRGAPKAGDGAEFPRELPFFRIEMPLFVERGHELIAVLIAALGIVVASSQLKTNPVQCHFISPGPLRGNCAAEPAHNLPPAGGRGIDLNQGSQSLGARCSPACTTTSTKRSSM